jgi:hypothetical protein
MSAGYVERLLARARGENQGIRPVVPALFTPPGNRPHDFTLEEVSEPRVSQPAASAQVQAQPAAGQAVPGDGHLPGPAERGPGRPAQDATAIQMVPAPAVTQSAAALPTPNPTAERAGGTPPPDTSKPLLPAQVAPHSSRVEPNGQPGIQPEAAPAQARPEPPPPPVADRLLLPLIQLPQGAPAQSTALARADEKEKPEPAPPSLHISIGRIEVRAVPPPSSAPAPAPRVDPHPALGLDEYLRRLNEEKR